MKTYQVNLTVRLELSATATVRARNQDDAEKKAEALAGNVLIGSWKPADECPPDVEWDETDQTVEVESVEEE